MPKYVVKDTLIRHGEGKEAKDYAPGDEIELTAAQAKALGGSVEPASQAKAKEK
jgi:hypothetical protein